MISVQIEYENDEMCTKKAYEVESRAIKSFNSFRAHDALGIYPKSSIAQFNQIESNGLPLYA